MTLMDWVNSWGRRAAREVMHRDDRLSNDRWLAEEEHRQLQEVRERLERVERQLETIAHRRSDS